MAYVLEAAMLACFGLSWPMNAYKSFKAGTAQGASWQFLALITVGYVAGIAAKTMADPESWVLAVYYLNLAFLLVNWWVYFRNRRLDAAREGRLPQRDRKACEDLPREGGAPATSAR